MRNCMTAPYFLNENGNFVGIHLPADFTAEHEWGIKDLKRQFGIPEYENTDPPFGIERYKATQVPETYLYQEQGNRTALGVIRYKFQLADTLFEHSKLKGSLYKVYKQPSDVSVFDIESRGAWDEHSFGIVAEGKQAHKHLQTLDAAIKNCDVVLFLGGGLLFENAGLNVAIASAIPENLQKTVRETHQDTAKLYQAAKATGIYEMIPKNTYYALRPDWKLKDKKSKHKVMFWLNPRDQRNNNYGWFTVEELDDWMYGRGPIPKVNRGCV